MPNGTDGPPCDAVYVVAECTQGPARLECLMSAGHEGPHWHKGRDIRVDPGVHWRSTVKAERAVASESTGKTE
jgi:hypothetical protein